MFYCSNLDLKKRMTEKNHLSKSTKFLGISLVITLSFFIIELIGGFLTNSLALITDSWHMLNDVFALAFSLVATWIAKRPETSRHSYGYHRAEILAAFLQGVFLWVVVFFMFTEVIERLYEPAEILSFDMLIIASLGLIANGASALMLSKFRKESLNLKGAFLHVAADILGSIGAVSAGIIIYFTSWYQADSLISLMIGILILYSSWKIIRESANVLLESVPSHIDPELIETKIKSIKGVCGVHDLHVWSISPEKMSIMSGHIEIDKKVNKKDVYSNICEILKEDFGILHTTLQLEDEDYPKFPGEH
jgi:cobalt-zinc-cadmium efflux system protein